MLKSRPFKSLFVLVSCLLYGQQMIAQSPISMRSTYVNEQDSSLESLRQFVGTSMGLSVDLKRNHKKQSPIGIHEQFEITHNGLPISQLMVKRNRYANGKTYISYPTIRLSTANTLPSGTRNISPEIINIHTLFETTYISGYQYYINNNKLVHAFRISGLIRGEHLIQHYSSSGELLESYSPRLFNKPDSLVSVSVFSPDPLSISNTEYGELVEDMDDLTGEALNNLMLNDSILIRWDSLKEYWILESDYAAAADLYDPDGNPPVSTTGNFNFTRDEWGFEYVNAFYHINRQHDRLLELGFTDVVDYPLEFDGHGDIDDQSFFDPITLEVGQLGFGDGGVDDAEDADVIVHEYGHAIIYSIAPGTVVGAERNAIEEGTCDFFALSYSRAITPNQSDRIFNWDGHNEFWTGRELTYSRTYPSDLEDDLYLDAPIWTSALADIHDYYGQDVSESLVLTAIYSFFPNMNMVDASVFLLQADSLLYNGEHSEIISIILCKRGLLANCADTDLVDTPLKDPFVGGHANFATSDSPLYLYPNDRTILEYTLYDLSGKLLRHVSLSDETRLFHELNFHGLSTGFYILSVHTTEGDFSFKLLKQIN